MVFGFFLYSRLVQKMGLNNIILIAPAFFMVVFFSWFYRDALPIALLGLIAREGMAYTFDDNNLILLISGVPSKVKNQVRVSIESFFEPAGMFISAALLLLFRNESKLLGLFLSLAALAIVFLLRAEYPKAIFSNLVAGTIRFEKRAAEWLSSFSKREKKEIELLLLSNLRKVDEPIQLLAYEYLLKIGNARLLRRLLAEFGRFTLPGKLKAIELISDSPWAREKVVIERFERLRVTSPHPSLNSAIHFYFARQGLIRPEKMIDNLGSSHLGLRGAAILSLKTEERYADQANEQLNRLLNSSDSDEICMALRILECEKHPSNQELILPFLKHSSLSINRAAARALSASTRDEISQKVAVEIISLLPQMRDSEVRLYALESLENLENVDSIRALIMTTIHFRPKERKVVESIVWGMGAKALPTLIAMTQEKDVHARCRLLAGKILGKLSLSDLKAILYPIVRNEIEKAYFYFYHWHNIQMQVPEHDLFILENTLLAGYESTIDFIVQLLGVAGSIEESDVLSHTLRSKYKKIQAQAHESLEKTCDPRIFSLLSPLIKNKNPDEKVHDYLKGGRIPLNFSQLLEILMHSPIPAEQIVAITLKARLGAPGWRRALEEKMQKDEKTFQNFAHQLLTL